MNFSVRGLKMNRIFVNLKRFEVPREQGGVCPAENPYEWIQTVMISAARINFDAFSEIQLVYILPEGLIHSALGALSESSGDQTNSIAIGCQGVHWKDIEAGVNFGAFSSLLPAKSAYNLGCQWAMIGHSEERRAKLELLSKFNPEVATDPIMENQARSAVDATISEEVSCAAMACLNILLCVGETESQRGSGSFDEQEPRIKDVLREQLSVNLSSLQNMTGSPEVVIGYEPIWAIGPGKIPPGPDYIAFVSGFIKKTVQELYGFTPGVVYGGGLKEENAASIAAIETIDGGLVALTRFTGDIAYEPEGFRRIAAKYLNAAR